MQEGDSWLPDIAPQRSAYRVMNGSEPDFTNYAKIQDQDAFIDTLDYIFLSEQWKVNGVRPLPHRDEVGGPLPNMSEPSDHILLSAALELPQVPRDPVQAQQQRDQLTDLLDGRK